ncbi:MAG: aminoglycoside phosphotransferase family protein [Bacteroidota bacterium]
METILRQFFDFEQLVASHAFGGGHINDTFRIEFLKNGERQTWLLQRLNHHVFKQPEAVMHNIRLVADQLAKQDFHLKILTPIPTRTGALLHHDEAGNYWRVFPFFEKTIAFDKVETEEQAFQAAKTFGAFAKALNGMAVDNLKTTIPGFHDGERRLAYFKEVLARAMPERLAEAKMEVEEILANQLIFKKIANLDLPRRAIHHDTKINNVLFDDATRQPVAVVDLDTVMPGIILSDFGDMMRTFTSPVEEDEPDVSQVEMRMPVFQALSEGFLSEMSDVLTPVERENLAEGGRWLTLMQAVRFLADYLEGDVYYKTKYPAHNLVRARNQLALFRSMKV